MHETFDLVHLSNAYSELEASEMRYDYMLLDPYILEQCLLGSW